MGECPGSAVVSDRLIYDFRPVSSNLGMWSVSDIWASVPVALWSVIGLYMIFVPLAHT